jgi:hypothetical protein
MAIKYGAVSKNGLLASVPNGASAASHSCGARRVRADTQCECKNNDDGEDRILPQYAQTELQVLKHFVFLGSS